MSLRGGRSSRRSNPQHNEEIAHLHCNTPALVGGAREVATTQLKLNAQNPAWSPDSKFLAFSGDAERGEWHDF